MNEQTMEELAHKVLSSAFTLEKALVHYVKSACVLIESQMKLGHVELLGKTISSLINQIYALQNLISRKIMILSEYSNDTILFTFILDYKEFDYDLFLAAIEQIYSFSKRCYLSEPKRIQLREEINQLFRVLKERQGMLNQYEHSKNDLNTIWIAQWVTQGNN